MYEKPYDIVKREFNNKEFVGYLELVSGKLDLLVNFGSWLFMWCSKDNRLLPDEKIVLLLILRRVLELTDAISILIKKSSIDSCKILLRSLLETYFETEYLLSKESDKRSKCYIVWYLNQVLKLKYSFAPESKEGKLFYEAVNQDKFINRMTPFKPGKLRSNNIRTYQFTK